MFRNLLKRCSGSGPKGGKTSKGGAIGSPLPSVVGAGSATAADQLVTTDLIGQTLVATIVEPVLNAERAAEVALLLGTLRASHPAAQHLVVDLQNLEYLDSAGLNMLVQMMHSVRKDGGRTAIASAKNRIEGLFKLTRLDQVFPIRRSVLEAIDAIEHPA